MKLWVDDEREPPDASWHRVYDVWTVVLMLLERWQWEGEINGPEPIGAMSLDHDLGEGNPTGLDLLHVMHRLRLTVPVIKVHSMNPEGKAAMLSLIEQFELAR